MSGYPHSAWIALHHFDGTLNTVEISQLMDIQVDQRVDQRNDSFASMFSSRARDQALTTITITGYGHHNERYEDPIGLYDLLTPIGIRALTQLIAAHRDELDTIVNRENALAALLGGRP
jgi:hypothetical protein